MCQKLKIMTINFCKFVIIYILFVTSTFASDIYFAGFTLIGNANQTERYPVASKLFLKSNEALNSKLSEALKELKRKDLNIIKDSLGNIKSGNALSLAFALNDERVERLTDKDGIYSFYKVLAQVLVFDIVEKKVITNFPAAIQYQIYSKKIPTRQEDEIAFQKIYMDTSFEGSIFKEWVARLDNISLKDAGIRHLQIREVDLDENVIKQLPEQLKSNDIFKTQTAQRLEFQLASNQNIPILPYVVGQLGNKKLGILGRFSDGVRYDLKLPDPDYVIDILVREFKSAKIEEKNIEGYVYGAFITLKVSEPLSGSVKVDSKFNYKNELTFLKNDQVKILNDWDVYQRSQDMLFSILSKQISLREDGELAKITSTINIKDQLKEFEGIIKKCK
jgi:hypothetical protein